MPDVDGTLLDIDQAADAAVSSLETNTEDSQPEQSADGTPDGGAVESETEQSESTQAPEPQEPSEATAFEQIDPSTLPPELQATYKNLMKGFTQGRQKDRSEVERLIKENEQLRHGQTEGQEQPMTIEELVEQKLEARELQTYATTAQEGFSKIDPRLDHSDPSYSEMVHLFVGTKADQALDEYLEAGNKISTFDYQTVAKTALKAFDQMVDAEVGKRLVGEKKRAQETLAKTRRLSAPSSSANTEPNQHMSLDDALEQAVRQKKN